MNRIELTWPEALTDGIKDIVKNTLRESILGAAEVIIWQRRDMFQHRFGMMHGSGG